MNPTTKRTPNKSVTKSLFDMEIGAMNRTECDTLKTLLTARLEATKSQAPSAENLISYMTDSRKLQQIADRQIQIMTGGKKNV